MCWLGLAVPPKRKEPLDSNSPQDGGRPPPAIFQPQAESWARQAAAQADGWVRPPPSQQGPTDPQGWVSHRNGGPESQHLQVRATQRKCEHLPPLLLEARSEPRPDRASVFRGSKGTECQKPGFWDTELLLGAGYLSLLPWMFQCSPENTFIT